jgi:hypothetical protein
MKVFIELEFEEMPSQAEVENYLHDLMHNNCLDWYVEEEENKTSIEEDVLAINKLANEIKGKPHE